MCVRHVSRVCVCSFATLRVAHSPRTRGRTRSVLAGFVKDLLFKAQNYSQDFWAESPKRWPKGGKFISKGGLFRLNLLFKPKLFRKELFANLFNLTEINLSSNKIEYLKENVFASLISLTSIDLSNNSITDLDNNLFKNLTKLNRINLSNNKIESINFYIICDLINESAILLRATREKNNDGTGIRAQVSTATTLDPNH